MVIYVEELYKKLYKLKLELDKLDVFNNIEKAYRSVNDNKELLSKIENYNRTRDDNIRLEIYNYDEIREYKRLENEVNLLILHINNKLKRINNERSCVHESN